MPFIPPRLDDRSFDDLVEELTARIGAHTPEWTDVRVGDPGRTLLELFAWLGDTILYRANLVPERQRLKFLELLQIPLRPPIAARTIVSIGFEDPAAVQPVLIQPGARIDGPVPFETLRRVTVLPLEAPAMMKRRATTDDDPELAGVLADLSRVYELPASATAEGYVTEEVFPGGDPRPEGFDLNREPVDNSLWFPLLALADADKDDLAQALVPDPGEPRWSMSFGIVPAFDPVDGIEPLPQRRELPLVWELTRPSPDGSPRFSTLPVLSDSTGGLVRDGVVEIALDVGRVDQLGAPSNDVGDLLKAGVGDRPPRLEDPKMAERLVAWVRARPSEPVDGVRIAWAGLNAVPIDARQTYENIIIGESTGRPEQRFGLPARPVDPQTFALQVADDRVVGGWATWQRVVDLGVSGPDDAHYVVDPEAGTVRFGDGMRGRVPPNGRPIRVTRMRAGGGVDGNVPPRTLTKVQRARGLEGAVIVRPLSVFQPLPTRGGLPGETLRDAEQRIPFMLRHRNRAVTEEDYRALAASVPGAPVGRVELLPMFKPHQRLSNVRGVVSVMVLPTAPWPPAQPSPRPDRRLLESVHDWLHARKPLGTELYVIGVEYVPVACSVAVRLRDDAPREATLLQVRRAVERHLWSLPPGGPDRRGWPRERAISARELEVVVARVPGVRAVNDLALFGAVGEGWGKKIPPAPNADVTIGFEKWQLPELREVLVTVSPTASADPTRHPNPFETEELVPVPVVPEVC